MMVQDSQKSIENNLWKKGDVKPLQQIIKDVEYYSNVGKSKYILQYLRKLKKLETVAEVVIKMEDDIKNIEEMDIKYLRKNVKNVLKNIGNC